MCFSRPRNEKGKELTKEALWNQIWWVPVTILQTRSESIWMLPPCPQIGPVCLCYLIPVESCYLACSVFWFISAPAHLLKAVNSQPSRPADRSTTWSSWLFCKSMYNICSCLQRSVITGKYLSVATVNLTSQTLSNRGKSLPVSSESHFPCILFVQHCPLKFFSGASPQAPLGAVSEHNAASQYSAVIYHYMLSANWPWMHLTCITLSHSLWEKHWGTMAVRTHTDAHTTHRAFKTRGRNADPRESIVWSMPKGMQNRGKSE